MPCYLRNSEGIYTSDRGFTVSPPILAQLLRSEPVALPEIKPFNLLSTPDFKIPEPLLVRPTIPTVDETVSEVLASMEEKKSLDEERKRIQDIRK
ncbi:MAG: hypothetical protein O7D29_04875 [Gemmatimonadetes bacterium]|nr:hypothetical protein [Gemmatimonadota bacterium]